MDMFIKHFATSQHILILDEPELNLHPKSKTFMARLFAKLVNSGIKVLVTTHSDNFVCELNNLIELNKANKKFKKEVMEEFGIEEDEILDFHRVNDTNQQKIENLKQSQLMNMAWTPKCLMS